MTQEEFGQAVERYGDMVFRVAYSCLKRREDAEDVMQETLLKLYREGKLFDSEDHRRFWLIRVAVNESRKQMRWYRRTVPMDQLPEAAAFDRPEQSELFRAVMSLPAKYRIAVHLYYYEGYSVREIGALTRTRESTVQTRLARARALLKQKLQEV